MVQDSLQQRGLTDVQRSPTMWPSGRGKVLTGKVNCGGLILVADGDAVCRALVAGLFERVGYTTCEAATGYEALALAEADRPRLVLLDVELPGITGYETCRELRDRYGESLPIVFLSGTRVEPLDRIAGLLIGADDYIVKPFEPGELLARARSLLRRSNGSTAGPTTESATAGWPPTSTA